MKITRELIIRIIFVFIGNIVMSLGVSIFKLAQLGNDPYNGMMFGLSDALNFPYPWLQVIIGGSLFVIQIILDRHTIGIGSVVNVFGIGFFVDFFNRYVCSRFTQPVGLGEQLVVFVIGILFCCMGISLYQESKLGVSPYDSISLIMAARQKKIPYFWCRMMTDGICALVCFLSGGLLGIGTVITAFGLGPVVAFYNKFLSVPLLGTLTKKKDSVNKGTN